MIGREPEYARLLAYLDASEVGVPTAVLITAEAGTGKTRLADEVARTAAARGHTVARGNCTPSSATRLPFGPLADLVRDLREQHPELRGAVTDEVWAGLAPIIAGWEPSGQTDAVRSGATDAALSHARLFAAVIVTIQTVAAEHPLVLMVEDLHWADPASLDLLGFIARKLADQNILLLVTSRPPHPSDELMDFLGEFTRLEVAETIELAPLPAAAIADLIAEVAPELDLSAVEALTARAAGSPFFATRLARHGARPGLPTELEQLLQFELRGASPAARRVASVVAALGGRVGVDELEILPGVDAVVAELAERDILTGDGDELRLRHALIGEVLEASGSRQQRRQVHAAAAEVLAARGGTDGEHDLELGRHLLAAGRPGEAGRHLLAGARRAFDGRSFVLARDAYAELIRLPAADVPLGRTALLLEAVPAYHWSGDAATALELLAEAEQAPGADAARVAFERGRLQSAEGRVAESAEAFRVALALLDGAEGERLGLRARVRAALALDLMNQGDMAASVATASGAMTDARAAGEHHAEIDARITHAVAGTMVPSPEPDADAFAEEELRSCARLALAADDLESVVRAYGNLTFLLGVREDYRGMVAVARQAFQDAERYGPVMSVASTLTSNYVSALNSLGEWDEALGVARAGLSEQVSPSMAVYLHAEIIEIQTLRGEWADVEAHLAAAQELLGDGVYALQLVFAAAGFAFWRGAAEEAATQIAAVLEELRDQDDPVMMLDALRIALRSHADARDERFPRSRNTAADAVTEALIAAARDTATAEELSPLGQNLLRFCEAEHARYHDGDEVRQWQAIADAARGRGNAFDEAYARYRGGVRALEQRATGEASDLLARSHELAAQLRARPLLERITGVAHAGGLRLDAAATRAAARPPAIAGLSDRELQVLELIADGLSNRDIAQRLYISERTVGVHVSRILGKLGARNRTEAARAVAHGVLDSAEKQE